MGRAWMPLYVADFVADTMHLSRANRGSYMSLICHYWRHGGLPNDLALLQQICSTTPEEWVTEGPILASFFTVTSKGWVHKRIEKEMQVSDNKYEKRRRAGKLGGKKKASNASFLLEQNPSNALPTTTTYKEVSKKGSVDKNQLAAPNGAPYRNGEERDPLARYYRIARDKLGAQPDPFTLARKLLDFYGGDTGEALTAISLAAGKAEPRTYLRGIMAKRNGGNDQYGLLDK